MFDGHEITIPGDFRRNLAALAPWTTVKIIEAGVGVVGWGVITSPERQIDDQGDRIVLALPNITEQLRLSDTDIGWVASVDIATLVARIVSLRPGWTGTFTDVGADFPDIVTSAPVQWGTVLNVTAAASTLTKTGGTDAVWDAGALSAQVATLGRTTIIPGTPGAGGGYNTGGYNVAGYNAGTAPTPPTVITTGGDCATTFVCLSAATEVICGLTTQSGVPGIATVDFGLWCNSGTLRTVERNVASASLGPVATGDILRVAVESGVVNYYRNNLLVATSGVPPVGPFRVAGYIGTANAQLGAATFTRFTSPSEAWFTVRFESQTALGAILETAKDTSHHARMSKRAADAPDGSYRAGDPMRGVDFGSFGADAELRLVSVGGGNANAVAQNPDVRIITALSRTRDASNVVNSVTPLGAGDGDTQVTLEHCWRIVNDPDYPNYNRYGAVSGTVFPEYDPAFPIEQRAALDGRFAYRLTSVDSLAAWEAVMPSEGEMRGTYADPQFAYTDKSDASHEVTARGLYVAAKAYLANNGTAHDTLALTVTGAGRVARAGDKVHVAYRKHGADADGLFVAEAIDADYFVTKWERAYDDNGPVTDRVTLSDKGFNPLDSATRQADAARKAALSQLVPTEGLIIIPVQATGADMDVAHPFDYSIPMPNELFRVRTAPLTVTFMAPRRNVTVAAETTHQHDYTIPSLPVTVSVSGTAFVTLSGTASVNVSGTAFVNVSGGATINNWGNTIVTASVSGSASVNNWGGVGANVSASGYSQSFTRPDVPGHDNQANHGTSINVGSHSHVINTQSVFVDIGSTSGHYSTAVVSGTTVVTSISAFNTDPSHTHGENIVTSFATSPTVSGTQSSATIGQFTTINGSVSLSGTATGTISGTASGGISGSATGNVGGTGTGTMSGSGSGTISGTGSGSISGTGSGTANASGSGSTALTQHTIGPSGGHLHALTPGIVDMPTSMRVALYIDSGDGQFIDRSVALGGPWESSFSVPDVSQWVNAPGRLVRLRLQPQSLAGQLDGFGSAQMFGSWIAELGGVSSVVYAS